MKRYMPFIKFIFSHDYYNFCNFRDIKLFIYKGKQIAENNYKLLLRKSDHGEFTLFIDTNDNFDDRLNFLINDLSVSEELSLLLKSENEHLQTCTKSLDVAPEAKLKSLKIPIQANGSYDFKLTEIDRNTGGMQLERDILHRFPKSYLYLTFDTSAIQTEELKYRIIHEKPLIVNIQLEAKSVFWKYIFLPRIFTRQKLSVIDSKQLIHFSDIDWSESSKTRQIGIAYSKTEIPFRESYSHRPQLWKLHTNGKSLLIEDLSTPNIAHTGNFSYEKNYVSIYQYI